MMATAKMQVEEGGNLIIAIFSKGLQKELPAPACFPGWDTGPA
jgi:hypothetical protein